MPPVVNMSKEDRSSHGRRQHA